LQIPHSSDFDFDSVDWTIELWIYAQATSGTMLGKRSTTSQYAPFLLQITGGNLRVLVEQGSGGSWDHIVHGGTINENQWYHVAVTRSGQQLRLFKNGVVVGSAILKAGALYANTAALTIGAGA